MNSGFVAKLYLRGDAGYAEERSVSASGELSEERQCLRFDLPSGATGLRLDLAERPGFLQLHALCLRRGGQARWEWRSGHEGSAALAGFAHHQIVFGAPAGLLLLCGDDPWLELPIDADDLAAGAPLQLEVALQWRFSPAGLAFPGAPALALQGFSALAQHALELAQQARALADEAARAHHMHLQSELELTQLRDALPASATATVRPLARTVDVVVPVYLGLDETRRCIEAVLSCPVRTPWRLVLVNDASPAPALRDWLRQLAASDPRISLLENPENLGYSGSVNRGIGQSQDHDVVLLNSDAEVANDWLDRLRAAAYCGERVGTVTPFTNNGTVCSYPGFCQPNAMVPGRSLAEIDLAFAAANAGRVVELPTAVGFCMYIRRDCLREVGLFDMDTFGKGYGEENDFCLRASALGWRDLHALDVFVQHEGGVSFGDSKPQRERDALVTLARLYPEYDRKVHDFIRRDPAAAARQRAGAALAAAPDGPATPATPARPATPATPAVSYPLFRPLFRTDEVLAEIRDGLDRAWTGAGPKTREFERRWCDYTGLPHSQFLNSASAGLHLALAVLKESDGWQDGDEVISTPLTFVATNHAILHCGLKPVFADVDEYLTLDPAAVQRCITPRTRAVMFVGLGGNSGRFEQVAALCRARGLRLLLDAAHMSGTRLRGQHAGHGADASIFSFQAVKNLPTADAGALCFADAALDARARTLAWLGIDRSTFSRLDGDGSYRWQYEVNGVGFKYQGNDVTAAMALVALRYLDADNARRRELCAAYDAALGGAVEPVLVAPGCNSSRHLYQVLVDERERVIDRLAQQGVLCGVHYRDNTRYPMYRGPLCPRAREASERVLSLPLHAGMSVDDVGAVARALRGALTDPVR